MKRVFLLCLPFLLLSFFVTGKPCVHDETAFRCVRYVRNYDGDTVTFNVPKVHSIIGKKIGVRIFGVETAEITSKSKCERKKAQEAKKFVNRLLKNAKRIDLEKVKRGKYFRIVAGIRFDGKSLTEYLLKSGLAYPYKGEKKPNIDWCKPLKKQIQTKKAKTL